MSIGLKLALHIPVLMRRVSLPENAHQLDLHVQHARGYGRVAISSLPCLLPSPRVPCSLPMVVPSLAVEVPNCLLSVPFRRPCPNRCPWTAVVGLGILMLDGPAGDNYSTDR